MSEYKDSGADSILLVSGGLGRNIIYTSIVEHLKELKYKSLDIAASYPLAFKNLISGNQMNFEFLVSNITDFQNKRNLDCDPYTMHGYRTGAKHFVQCWLENQFGIRILRRQIKQPKIILSEDELKNARDTIRAMGIPDGEKIALVQFVGGTSYFSPERVQCTAFQKRTLPDECAQAIVDRLISLGFYVIQYKLPAEKKYKGTVSLKKVLDFRTWSGIIKASDAIVCIDSSASHVAPAVGKRALVFWSATNPIALGWDNNWNITRSDYRCKNKWVCNGCGRPNTHYFDQPNWMCKYNFECGNYNKDDVLSILGEYLHEVC